MKHNALLVSALLAVAAVGAAAQASPPWSGQANDPARDQGYVFHVADIDNVPDLHGNPNDAKFVLFIGGNQFFVLPELVAAFEAHHPELTDHIFYETLPPGILRQQMAARNTVTLGNLTINVQPDVYEAGMRAVLQLNQSGQLKNVVPYATNNLEIMIRAGNPKGVHSLNDLARPDLRLSMPNPQWEGVANQIASSLRKAGGDTLYKTAYEAKVRNGSTILTEIHHRQTPMRIMNGEADAGVTWASEVRFQESIHNPIAGVQIPEDQNTTAIYAGGVVTNALHPQTAAQWLEFLRTPEAQAIYHRFGFQSYTGAQSQE
jgi:molybdate transport system substrate-binding protein